MPPRIEPLIKRQTTGWTGRHVNTNRAVREIKQYCRPREYRGVRWTSFQNCLRFLFYPVFPRLVFCRPPSHSATGISFDGSHGPGTPLRSDAPLTCAATVVLEEKKWNAITSECKLGEEKEHCRIGSETPGLALTTTVRIKLSTGKRWEWKGIQCLCHQCAKIRGGK